MWPLNTTSKSLKAFTAVAPDPTAPVVFMTAWFDQSGNRSVATGPDSQNGTITDSVANIVDPPGQSNVSRHVSVINVNNGDSINHTITVQFDTGTARTIFKCVLQPGWTAEWMEQTGWIIYTELGIRF